MITILGAGGAIGNELVRLLAPKNQPFRLVGRNPNATPGATETLASSVVHLLVGLKYDRRVWQDMWPRIMSNTIEACKRAGARLIFFDNMMERRGCSDDMIRSNPRLRMPRSSGLGAQTVAASTSRVSRLEMSRR